MCHLTRHWDWFPLVYGPKQQQIQIWKTRRIGVEARWIFADYGVSTLQTGYIQQIYILSNNNFTFSSLRLMAYQWITVVHGAIRWIFPSFAYLHLCKLPWWVFFLQKWHVEINQTNFRTFMSEIMSVWSRCSGRLKSTSWVLVAQVNWMPL